MSGYTWTSTNDINLGWGYNKKGKVDWFAHKGTSEKVTEIKTTIFKFQADKDYSYDSNSIETIGICEKYTIYNANLKAKLWELLGELEIDTIEIPEILEIPPIWIKPIRPIGIRKNNEIWKVAARENRGKFQKKGSRSSFKTVRNYFMVKYYGNSQSASSEVMPTLKITQGINI